MGYLHKDVCDVGFHSCCCAFVLLNIYPLHSTVISLYLSLSFSLSLFLFHCQKVSCKRILPFQWAPLCYPSCRLGTWSSNTRAQRATGQHFRCKPSHTQHSPMGWTNEFVDISYRSIGEESVAMETLRADTSRNSPSQPRCRLRRTATMVLFTWQAASQVRVTFPPVVELLP